MDSPLHRDVDEFLFALGTFEEGVPEAFEEYARTEVNLLWASTYCLRKPRSGSGLHSRADRSIRPTLLPVVASPAAHSSCHRGHSNPVTRSARDMRISIRAEGVAGMLSLSSGSF